MILKTYFKVKSAIFIELSDTSTLLKMAFL